MPVITGLLFIFKLPILYSPTSVDVTVPPVKFIVAPWLFCIAQLEPLVILSETDAFPLILNVPWLFIPLPEVTVTLPPVISNVPSG